MKVNWNLKKKLVTHGIWGLLTLFGLQFAQIFLIILPGEPIEILAGMCYGGLGGLIFVTASAFIISSVIFFMVRKLGKKFVYDFCDEEKVKKIEESKIFKNPKKIEWIMIILFLIPGTPKDLLVYIAALLPIKPLRFILISTFARFPSVVSSTFAGDNLLEGNWQNSIIIYAVTFLLVGISIFIVNKLDKSKTTEEALRSFQKEIK
ncbi:MAG: TVP38/TMEM64 family protein [Clostridia bacterium]|nr:TVP38/TMEM64 family protein [Clostridium sp.]MBS6252131.1 TVP38/TMEM64 family protein [Clostridium sp.]